MLKRVKTENRKIILWILLCFILSRLSFFAVYVYARGGDLRSFVSAFNVFDAGWYGGYVSDILNGGFAQHVNENGQAVWAFFPLFPMIVAGAVRVLGTADVYLVGSVISSVFFMLAEYAAYRYIMLTRKDLRLAFYYITFMSFGVYSFYFSILYTESLFLLLVTLCFYFLEKEEYIKMGICGALMSASRNVGILFVFVVLIRCILEYLRRSGSERSLKDFILTHLKNEKLVLGTFMIPIGLFAYMAYLEYALGDGLAFVHVQIAWERAYGNVLIRIFGNLFYHGYRHFCALILTALLILWMYDHRRYHEMVIPGFNVLMALMTSVMSLPRFFVGSFTGVLAFCDEFSGLRKPVKLLAAAILFIIEIGLILEWINLNPDLC